MNIGIVTHTVTSTMKHKSYHAATLLLVEIINPEGKRTGKQVIAVDRVSAGIGDTVLVMREGNSTRLILGSDAGPVLELIVGIVDIISMEAEVKWQRKK